MQKKFFQAFATAAVMVSVLSTGIIASANGEYVVQRGDSLRKIAQQSYGDEKEWEKIYEANKDSIKKPDIIYSGQVLVIPDSMDSTTTNVELPSLQAVDEIASPEANAVADTLIAPVANVPVGLNPIEDSWGYKYTFTDGSYALCNATKDYIAETTDIYGITYREYRKGANEKAIKGISDYIVQNPNSNFASMIQQYGNQFVIITSNLGLADDENDYDWTWGIIDCEPEDCVYLFIAGNAVDEGYVETVYPALFDSVSEHININ